MAGRLKRKQEIDLVIEKVAFGGKGVGYFDEMVVFVEDTLPGDRVKARVRKSRKSFAEAYPLEILVPSQLRREAPCVHFGHCGGCKWQNVDYPTQLAFKKQHVVETLRHIGRIEAAEVHDVLPSPLEYGYRNKMEFSFSENRWLTPEELADQSIRKGFALGLHVPRFFDRILDIQRCWLQTGEMNGILDFSRDYFKNSGISVYNLHTKQGVLRYLVLRQSFAREELLVNVVTSCPFHQELEDFAGRLIERFPKVVSVYNTVNSRVAQIASGETYTLVWGEPVIREKLGRFEFEISPESFFQTNSLQAENLYKVVKQYARAEGLDVWDLYSGAGSIAIYLADQVLRITGFEIVESAVLDARRNAGLNGICNCEFISGDLRFNLQARQAQAPQVIICDPPRAGMHQDVLDDIVRIAPQRVVYVSCNPATLARDLTTLSQGYQVAEVQPVDMFPHTYHIECVVRLERICAS